MDILIEQDAGFGDIFFCQKIAVKLMEQGHTVYWPVYKEYEYIKDYIHNGVIWNVPEEKRSKIRSLNINQSTNYFKFAHGKELGFNVMQTKYRYADNQFKTGGWEDWQDYFKINRNYKRERILENKVLEGVPEKFSLVCNHFATDYQLLAHRGAGKAITKAQYPIVEITKLPNTHLFDWCGIIQKASEIRIPDSSFPYLVEILKTTDNIHMYARSHEGQVKTKPIWKKEWNFVEKWERTKMRFLVTGISGFVAPYLAKYLLANNHEVYGMLHNSSLGAVDGIQYVMGDLCDIRTFKYLREYNFDGVFHLAGLTHPPTSFKEPELYYKTNATGTMNLCEVFRAGSVIMQCSTPEVYGECSEEEIFETFAMLPNNPYGVSKAEADRYILKETKKDKLNAFIVRAGSHTGAGRPSCYSISSDAEQIVKIKKGLQEPILKVGNINSQRAVMDVRDVVIAYYELMIKYMDGKIPNGEIYHVSGHKVNTIEFYIDMMLQLAGIEAEKVVDESLVRKIDIPIQILNSDKMRELTGWSPVISTERTLKDLLAYWENKIGN